MRLTIILDPRSALLLWAHYAPPLNDSFRVSYRQMLRWNDELPFVKFALADDDRPVLTAELPVAGLDLDGFGLAICRLLAVCDLTFDRALPWLHPGAKVAPTMDRPSRQAALFERYATALPELVPGSDGAAPGAASQATDDGP